ncbi:DNA (cytosine-5)-methyltransferase 3A-like [Ruditapes philippinarum]|uniref:DNA (cytosine-5)-methyltransferase 3A-like n=1 Tax=Ruditapes philippinarum TaxID=129788 RepID=UPI00295C237A|nr:DNA (cytosine-5)-methyltransferase 3A-like [Ruditapes philippinarum]
MLGLDMEVYYASEIDEHARLVSSLHHEVKHVGNVLNLDLQRLKKICPIDLVLGGPPCNDLSIVNPRRKGFDGTGKLVWTFAAIVKDIERICEGYNHVFWLMENTAAMPKVYKQEINEKLGMEPAKWDAKHFSGQRRARNFWGNIPGMFTQPELNKLLESEKKDLSHAVYKCGRLARIPHSRTITTSANSLTITNGKNDHLVLMDGVPVPIWIPEIERLFGFHDHYTDAGLFLDKERQALLGRSWCVDVIKQLLSPLRSYFKVKQT